MDSRVRKAVFGSAISKSYDFAKDHIAGAKNDPFGRGRQAYLSERGLSIVGKWVEAAGISEGAILRIVYQQQPGGRPIRPDQVGRILKGVARQAKLDATLVVPAQAVAVVAAVVASGSRVPRQRR